MRATVSTMNQTVVKAWGDDAGQCCCMVVNRVQLCRAGRGRLQIQSVAPSAPDSLLLLCRMFCAEARQEAQRCRQEEVNVLAQALRHGRAAWESSRNGSCCFFGTAVPAGVPCVSQQGFTSVCPTAAAPCSAQAAVQLPAGSSRVAGGRN